VIARAGAGLALALAIALAAWRAGALSASGAVAATVVGTLAAAAGWEWAALLIAYFVSATALSRLGEARKARRTARVVAKGGRRDAVQVLANGGVFAGAAALSLVAPWPGWAAVGVGSLSAAAADTWGTELGTLVGSAPRLVTTGRRVPPGTSGAVTAPGMAATVAGALFTGGAAWMLGWPREIVGAAAAGGFAGALADSLVGATLQARRRCDRCAADTEQPVHACGAPTRHAGGVAWLENDLVNVVCAFVGGATALLWTSWR
jgi:uncharacterized protein (TIGR00297 family)